MVPKTVVGRDGGVPSNFRKLSLNSLWSLNWTVNEEFHCTTLAGETGIKSGSKIFLVHWGENIDPGFSGVHPCDSSILQFWMTQEVGDCAVHGEIGEPRMVKHVLVPETVWALGLSRVQKESVGTLWNSVHVLCVHEEAQADGLVVESWAWFKEKGVVVIDDCNYLVVGLDLDSERSVLNGKLEAVLACNGSASWL